MGPWRIDIQTGKHATDTSKSEGQVQKELGKMREKLWETEVGKEIRVLRDPKRQVNAQINFGVPLEKTQPLGDRHVLSTALPALVKKSRNNQTAHPWGEGLNALNETLLWNPEQQRKRIDCNLCSNRKRGPRGTVESKSPSENNIHSVKQFLLKTRTTTVFWILFTKPYSAFCRGILYMLPCSIVHWFLYIVFVSCDLAQLLE